MTPTESKQALKSAKQQALYAFQKDFGNSATYVRRMTKNPQVRAVGLPVLSAQHVPRVTVRRAMKCRIRRAIMAKLRQGGKA